MPLSTTTDYRIGLGSNLGDTKTALTQALKKLNSHPRIHLNAVSPLYLTEPIGPTDQPGFLNAVAGFTSDLPPRELLAFLKKLEQESGRVKTRHWGERTLDLDILLYGNEIIHTRELIIPHPRMHERLFVLIPLFDLTGDITIPGTPNQTIAMAIKTCEHNYVRRFGKIEPKQLL